MAQARACPRAGANARSGSGARPLARAPPRAAARATRRGAAVGGALSAALGGLLGRAQDAAAGALGGGGDGAAGPTNEQVRKVGTSIHRRLGGGGVYVSELGLGTQRWGGDDFNSPDEALCHAMLDYAVLERGVNLVDTAEQYPIPSAVDKPEGATERIIGSWLAKDRSRRDKLCIATKITGGRNVTASNIRRDCEGSLRRLGTDHIDVYTLHWPARYTPQSNWGQSLEYHHERERDPYYADATSFEEIAEAMGALVAEGKIRGWGMCNDNAYGLAASAAAARALGVAPPIAMQNDYSLLNRRCDENGLSEASSPIHENCGFMAYNVLAGGVLTGKYADVPAAVDDRSATRRAANLASPRGRMDDYSWGRTLYRYRTRAAIDAAAEYAAIAAELGMTPATLAMRWARSRTSVTTSLLGATSLAQLEEQCDAFDASAPPLGRDALWAIDTVHMRNRLPLWSADDAASYGSPGRGGIGEIVP